MKLKSIFIMAIMAVVCFVSCECPHDLTVKKPIKLGWVVCADGSVISLCDWLKSDLSPVGIVYEVAENPQDDILGYAVCINDVGSEAFADSLGVKQNTSTSLTAIDGNENTYAIYTTDKVKSPMATKVMNIMQNGQSAYIPSVAQLHKIHSVIDVINYRIEAVGGDPISLVGNNCWLWSSTEVSGQEANKAWLYSMSAGAYLETPKDQSHVIRPVITIRKVKTGV